MTNASNVIPFPQRGGYNHHGAGRLQSSPAPAEYWWEVTDGSYPLPLFRGMSRDEVAYFVKHCCKEIQVFEGLLPEEAYETLLNHVPAELCKPKGAILVCGQGETIWAYNGRKWAKCPFPNR